jgi:hypothetical protein
MLMEVLCTSSLFRDRKNRIFNDYSFFHELYNRLIKLKKKSRQRIVIKTSRGPLKTLELVLPTLKKKRNGVLE